MTRSRVFRLWLSPFSQTCRQIISDKTQGVLAFVVALMVLLSAMWEPLVSVTVAAAALLLIGIFQLTNHSGRS